MPTPTRRPLSSQRVLELATRLWLRGRARPVLLSAHLRPQANEILLGFATVSAAFHAHRDLAAAIAKDGLRAPPCTFAEMEPTRYRQPTVRVRNVCFAADDVDMVLGVCEHQGRVELGGAR